MKFFTEHKNIFIGIGVAIVLFVLYSYFLKSDDTATGPSVVSTRATTPAEQSAASRDIIALLVDLKAIKIKADLFSDPTFRSLQDFSTPIPDEPRGRANPFAPIGVK